MKTIKYIILVAVCALFISCEKDENNNVTYTMPVLLGDPFILLHDGVYYAYGTNAADGIEVYTSADLQEWHKESKLALHKKDSYGERWFWAPEVYYIASQNKFLMYYSAEEHICAATSDSPLGPFVQEEQVPMIDNEKCIDNSLFIDDNGKAYLYFVRFNNGSCIWVAELEDDLQTVKTETLRQSFCVSQGWENIQARVNEGPFVMKHNGLYYMTYSANHFESPYYGVGYATASSPEGPWTKFAGNPILLKPENLLGTGHHAMFHDKDGQLKMVFHSHYSSGSVLPRVMHMINMDYTDDVVPVLQTSGEVLTPIVRR